MDMEHTEQFMLPSTVSFEDKRLSYSGQNCTRIPEALIKLYGPKVHSLDLSYNDLVTLKGLGMFSELRELILDNNQLSDSMQLPQLLHLKTLSLNKNHIKNLELLLEQVKHQLPSIEYISLLGNFACPNQLSNYENDEEDYQRYRYFVLYHLPNLKFLDSKGVTEEERREARRRGQFMNIVTPSAFFDRRVDVNINLNDICSRDNFKYSPLPRALRSPEDYKGRYH
ncbi:hypothetical protein ABEB36_003171 [Hypothenemus hampei]|uniref:Leucine-rich melanocyte differentiation-associated protein n=1 Tax=Hypothenemus hampei TaxID=57062 RepID=A0ABD1F8A2_HYPHA